MSISTFVIGIKPPDETWLKMKAVYDACAQAGVPIPDEVESYFEGERPDEKGVKIDLYITKPEHECISVYREEYYSGWEIEVAKIPKDIKIIRIIRG